MFPPWIAITGSVLFVLLLLFAICWSGSVVVVAFRSVGLLLLLLLPPLEVAFHAPCSVLLSVHLWNEGHHPFAAHNWGLHSAVGRWLWRVLTPLSVAVERSPPPLEVLLPSLPFLSARHFCGHSVAPGVTTPRLLCAWHSELDAGRAR